MCSVLYHRLEIPVTNDSYPRDARALPGHWPAKCALLNSAAASIFTPQSSSMQLPLLALLVVPSLALPQQAPLRAPPPALNDTVPILTALSAAADTMQQTFFEPASGTWPTGIDWTSAVLGSILAGVSGSLAPHDAALSDRYFADLVNFYHGQDVAALRGQAFDDILWGLCPAPREAPALTAQSS